jgi:hypothetical protein
MFPVESFQNTLLKAAGIFRRLAIRFHLTGGFASIAYGEPRLTQDVDIVVDHQALESRLDAFIASLADANFLADVTAIRTAVDRRGMFQLLDDVEILKLDIYPRELISGELDRSCLIEVFAGVVLPVVSRADGAASKLVWISKGSHKSRRDLRQVHRAASEVDRARIRELATSLFLESLLDEVLGESDEIA